MGIKNTMKGAAAVLLISLIFTYVLFETNTTEYQKQADQDTRQKIVLLSGCDLSQEQELLKELADHFNDSSQTARVEIQFIEAENLKKDVFLRSDGGDQLDILICSAADTPGFADMGVLKDLTQGIDGKIKSTVMYQDFWQSTMNDGKYYGLPFTCNPYVLFYNKTYLENHGLPEPDTWSRVFEICREIEGSGTYGLGMGIRRSEDAAVLFSSILYACGGNYYSLEGSYGIKALEILESMNRWGYIDKYAINSTPKDAAENFLQGRCVMLLAPLDTGSCLKNEGGSFSYGVLPMPGDVKEGYILSGENLCLLQNSVPEAKEFLDYLYQPEVRRQILNGTGTLPVFQDEFRSYQSLPDLEQLNEDFLSKGEVLPNYTTWFEISEIIQENISQLLAQRSVDIQEMARRMQDQIRVELINN